jgi:chromosome partitioning protein
VGVSQESGVFALDLIAANHELMLIDKVLYKRPGYQFRLREAISKVYPGLYQYIIIDCPPAIAPLTLNALAAADLIIIPAQAELYAAQSLRQTIKLALQMREQCNPDLEYRVLVTMYDMRNKISRMILDQMQHELDQILFETIIQIDTKLRESPAYGKPITSYAKKTRSAQQYRALAKELQKPEIARLLQRRQAETSECDDA